GYTTATPPRRSSDGSAADRSRAGEPSDQRVAANGLSHGTGSSRLTESNPAPLQALGRPEFACPVIRCERRYAVRQHDPGELRTRVDVHVRWQGRRIVQRANPDEAQLCHAAIFAPDRRAALGAPVYVVRPAAVGRHRMWAWFA